jgi:hypothetical protein
MDPRKKIGLGQWEINEAELYPYCNVPFFSVASAAFLGVLSGQKLSIFSLQKQSRGARATTNYL